MDKNFTESFKRKLFEISGEGDFNDCALELFRYQAANVEVYRNFLNALGPGHADISHYSMIPCMPVTLFRDYTVTDGGELPELCFTSSGTTGQIPSRHFVRDVKLYEESLLRSFTLHYGPPTDYIFFALLPSYQERSGSSLIYMMEILMKHSGHPAGGFYLNKESLIPELIQKQADRKIFLIGVTYALLDMAAEHPMDLSNGIIVETGGMKGRRKEMIREEVHGILQDAFSSVKIHSEYGMTELLSQAWSAGDGYFTTPPWMKVLMTDLHDPFSSTERGVIHIMDLANVHSCAFLATQDLGKKDGEGFTMLGRTDNSELRGCNLMIGG